MGLVFLANVILAVVAFPAPSLQYQPSLEGGRLTFNFNMCDNRRGIPNPMYGLVLTDHLEVRIRSVIGKLNALNFYRRTHLDVQSELRLCSGCARQLDREHLDDVITFTTFANETDDNVKKYVGLSKIIMLLNRITSAPFQSECELLTSAFVRHLHRHIRHLKRVLNDWRIIERDTYHVIQNGGCLLEGYFNTQNPSCDELRDLLYIIINNDERILSETLQYFITM